MQVVMKTSLLFKLLGAFLLVIAIGALVMTLLTTQATEKAFTLYTTRSGQAWAESLAPSLADYYAQSDSWTGVDAYLQSLVGSIVTTDGGGGMMGQGHGFGPGSGNGGGMMALMGQRLILANDQGVVIGDTENQLVGTALPASDLANGAAIAVNGSPVGTLIVSPSDVVTGTPASDFLSSVNKAIISSAGIAAVIALLIGAALFFQVISPVRKLRKAATSIAAGDLDQRVNIRSRDELGELGKSFNQMAESLSKAEIQRQHMIADVAHELRTPLAAMQGTLEGMQDGLLSMDREQVDALFAETTLLTRLVGDLRLLSLADAGELKLELQDVEPGELFSQILERAKTQTQAKNITLGIGIQPHLPLLHIDSDRITQVMNNLIGNAVRFTPEGGSIQVDVARPAAGNGISVSVTDSGPGIDAQDLPYIFDRFYRAEKSRARSSGGSGLGLAIVKQLVEAHGGRVSAESPVFKGANNGAYGTRISFTLPLSGR